MQPTTMFLTTSGFVHSVLEKLVENQSEAEAFSGASMTNKPPSF
jgi:hypothetical protein